MFVVGDGIGGTEKQIGKTDTENECADLVLSKESSANGATWGTGKCFAEFGATEINGAPSWRTCLFKGNILWFLRQYRVW